MVEIGERRADPCTCRVCSEARLLELEAERADMLAALRACPDLPGVGGPEATPDEWQAWIAAEWVPWVERAAAALARAALQGAPDTGHGESVRPADHPSPQRGQVPCYECDYHPGSPCPHHKAPTPADTSPTDGSATPERGGGCCCRDHDITSWDEIGANCDTPVGHGSVVSVPWHEEEHPDGIGGKPWFSDEFEVVCPQCPTHGCSGPNLLEVAREMLRLAHRKCADGFWSTCSEHATCRDRQRWARTIAAEDEARRRGRKP